MERFAFVLALIGPAFAQTAPDIRTIIEGVSKAYANQQQFDIVWVTTVEQYSTDGKAFFKGRSRVALQDAMKFRLEEGSPDMAPMVIIADGTDVWGVYPTINQYTKHKPSDFRTIQGWVNGARSNVFEPAMILGRKAADAKLTGEESTSIDGTSVACFVITLISPSPPKYTFWVEKKRLVIRRYRLEFEPDAPLPCVELSITTEFPVVNIGMAPPVSTFIFTPSPSATEVNKF